MFHITTVEPGTYSLLQKIFRIEAIRNQFALAGGTSLALQIGHRVSIDLDIFSPAPFDPKEIEIILNTHSSISFRYTGNNSRMLFGYANNIKCDFVEEPARLLHPFIENDGISYFSIPDIGAMKMHIICGRGKKKDFFDIYALLQLYSWEEMLSWFKEKYGNDQFYFLWRSIGYFADADQEPDLRGIGKFDKSWETIKQFIQETCVQ